MLSKAKAVFRDRLRRAGYDLHPVRLDDTADYIAQYGRDAVEGRRFYNVGSGSFFHPCWTNIDFVSDWYGGVQKNVIHHDLMSPDPLPIPTGSAEIIYSSHTIEHVEETAVAKLFREAYRSLKPGGVLRITTGPDADTDYEAMRRGDGGWFYWDREDRPVEEKWLHHVATPLAPHADDAGPKMTAAEVRELVNRMGREDLLNYVQSRVRFDPSRPGNHVSWWNGDKIIAFMREAGFSSPYRSGFGQSACPVLRNTYYFDNTHPQISVYVEAVR